MPSPDKNIYEQLEILVDTVSQRLMQNSRRQGSDGTQFIDGDLAEQAITWEVVASATRKATRRVQNAGADNMSSALIPFRIGIINDKTDRDILEQSQEKYSFPDVLRIAMAVYDCPTGGQLATRINSVRRRTSANPTKFSSSAVAKWLQGKALPTPHSFGEITQALETNPESPLPIHALTAQLLYRSYDSARREKDARKAIPKVAQRRRLSH